MWCQGDPDAGAGLGFSMLNASPTLSLIDEHHLLVHPVIPGDGTRLFEEEGLRTSPGCVDVEPFESGITRTVYQRL